MSISLRLQTIAGGSVEQGIADACGVASRLRIVVLININGIETMINPDDSSPLLYRNYLEAVKRDVDFVSAHIVPLGKLRPGNQQTGPEKS